MAETAGRLSELVGSLTLAADLLNGFPAEKVLRTAVVAVALAERAGFDPAVQRDAYYVTLFRFLGCTAFAHEEAHHYGAGDDISVRNTMALADIADPLGTLGAVVKGIGPGASLAARAKAMVRLVASPEAVKNHAQAQCEVSRQLAELVGMSDGTRAALSEVCERYDGRGFPAGTRGEALAVASRLFHLADAAEIVFHRAGIEAALQAVRSRAGAHLDPKLCAVFAREGADILAGLADGSIWQRFLDSEPSPHALATPERRERVALAFGRFTDLKSVYTLDHSQRVAELCGKAAELAQLEARAALELRVAGALHDLGRVSVPNRIWDKPGALDLLEWERVRLHAYHTERILARSNAWASAARLAGATHERLDARGYHRALSGRELSAAELGASQALLAAADVLVALRSERPHRPAHTPDRARTLLLEEASAGRLARDAVEIVLAASEGAAARPARERPCGLSEREVVVLRWVALGKSNAETAQLLGISPKTVKNHVANLYAKIGVYSRAGAALFAAEHGLLS